MKSSRKLKYLMIALASVATVTTAVAATTATTPTTTAPAFGGRHHHPHGPMLVGALLHATKQLNLTAAQQTSIQGILTAAKEQRKASAATPPDITVLGNPGDPNYSTALETLKTNSANRLDTQSALAAQIYAQLTNEQKMQLPTILAAEKAKMAARRAAWQQQHSGTAAE